MPEFIKFPLLDIYDEETGLWADPENWWTEGELIYQSDLYLPQIIVPDGFPTDLSSIPRVARFLIIKNGRHRPAAIVHDYLCREDILPDRVLADKIFLEAMELVGVPKLRRYAMYAAVRGLTFYLKTFTRRYKAD